MERRIEEIQKTDPTEMMMMQSWVRNVIIIIIFRRLVFRIYGSTGGRFRRSIFPNRSLRRYSVPTFSCLFLGLRILVFRTPSAARSPRWIAALARCGT